MKEEGYLLMTAGPVNVHPRVLRAMAKPAVYHRDTEFTSVVKECVEMAKKIFDDCQS